MQTCAILGASGITTAYLRNLSLFKNVRCKYLYSRSLERAYELQKLGTFSPTNQLEKVLEDPEVKSVLIFTEPARHVEMALQCLAHGKDVLIEKPVALDPNEAKDLLAFQEKNPDRIISVVSQMRFDPILKKLKTDLEKDPAQRVDAFLSYHRNDDYYQNGNQWRVSGSAVLLNQAIHWLDVFLWLFGPVESSQSFSKIGRPFLKCPDTTTALLKFKSGPLLTLSATTQAPKTSSTQISIETQNRIFHWERLQKENRWEKRFARLVHGRRHPWNLLYLQLKDFFDSVELMRPPQTTLSASLESLKLAHGMSALGTQK